VYRRSGSWLRFTLIAKLLIPAEQMEVYTVAIMAKVKLLEVELRGGFPAVSSPQHQQDSY
jgi:hypothetical protein